MEQKTSAESHYTVIRPVYIHPNETSLLLASSDTTNLEQEKESINALLEVRNLHITIRTEDNHATRYFKISQFAKKEPNYDIPRWNWDAAKRDKSDIGNMQKHFSGIPFTIVYYMAKDSNIRLECPSFQHCGWGDFIMFRGKRGQPYGMINDKGLFGELPDGKDKEIGADKKGKAKVFSICAVCSDRNLLSSSQQIFPRHEGSWHKQYSYISLAEPKTQPELYRNLEYLIGKTIYPIIGEEIVL